MKSEKRNTEGCSELVQLKLNIIIDFSNDADNLFKFKWTQKLHNFLSNTIEFCGIIRIFLNIPLIGVAEA